MKIVVMSDTHLSHVTDEFDAICSRYCSDADLVLHLGDMARGVILDYLEQYRLEAVCGNMDDHMIQSRLPIKKTIRAKGFRIGMAHGWGSGHGMRSRLRDELPGANVILFGHTHKPLQLEEDGILWFNPGSVFTGRGNLPRSLGILHVDDSIQSEIIAL